MPLHLPLSVLRFLHFMMLSFPAFLPPSPPVTPLASRSNAAGDVAVTSCVPGQSMFCRGGVFLADMVESYFVLFAAICITKNNLCRTILFIFFSNEENNLSRENGK